MVIADSDLLVIMPSRLAKTFSRLVSIKFLNPPVPLRPYDVKVYWHERIAQEPPSRWFRRTIVQLFRKKRRSLSRRIEDYFVAAFGV